MDWSQWRLEFPITEHVTHFNHAGVSPVSRRVAAAVTAFINEVTVVDDDAQLRWEARAKAVRASFARLVSAQPDEIAFVRNTSEGLSLVAAGLEWRTGDNVIAVDGEYPSNVYPVVWPAALGRRNPNGAAGAGHGAGRRRAALRMRGHVSVSPSVSSTGTPEGGQGCSRSVNSADPVARSSVLMASKALVRWPLMSKASL